MFFSKYFFVIAAAIIVFNAQHSFAQTFGFGCLGFVGGYGGFTYQRFEPTGLNRFINIFNEVKGDDLKNPLSEFSYVTGWRVGVNFFRATFEGGMIVTAKGYYQSLGKKNKAIETNGSETTNYSVDLDVKNWAIGFDVGLDVTKYISWKIVDGALHFNNITLTNTRDMPGDTEVDKYKSKAGVLGYSVGTGIIINLIKDYISIEGLAGYTALSVEDLYAEDGTPFTSSQLFSSESGQSGKDNFIESGGFNAVIQINVGFPL